MSDQLAGMPRIWGRVPTASTRLRQHTRLSWILTAFLAAGAIVFVVAAVRMVVTGGQAGPGLVSVLAWAVWSLVLFGLICLLDVYRHVPPSIRFAMLLWGAGVATVLSMLAEGVVDPVLGTAPDALSTGLIEEGTKLLGVILLAAVVPVLFRRPMGGLISGMMVGLGFSFFENLEYAIQAYSPGQGAAEPYIAVAATVFHRGFVDGAGLHLFLTGLTSLGVVYFVAHRGSSAGRRWAGALALILSAVVFHFLWDWGASIQGAFASGSVVTLNVLHFAISALMIIYAVRAERRWLANPTMDTAPAIESNERRSLRKHRTRRQARGTVTDPQAQQRMKTRQWAQIGYADALADGAPETETDRLAGYVSTLRQPILGTAGPGAVPTQRQADPSRSGGETSAQPTVDGQ